jgi:hypothetical protein
MAVTMYLKDGAPATIDGGISVELGGFPTRVGMREAPAYIVKNAQGETLGCFAPDNVVGYTMQSDE